MVEVIWKIFELKSAPSKFENLIEGIENRIEQAEEVINDLEDSIYENRVGGKVSRMEISSRYFDTECDNNISVNRKCWHSGQTWECQKFRTNNQNVMSRKNCTNLEKYDSQPKEFRCHLQDMRQPKLFQILNITV